MIEVEQLHKHYKDLHAVDGISFTARAGAIFGLLGPNGAGKSTTIGCISGLLKPTQGRVMVLGHDVVSDGIAARRALGVVPQEIALYEELSARDNLAYWGGAYGLGGSRLKTRAAEVLELTGLAGRAKEPVKNFSGGMKRRLNFACGIVHEPQVLLLDEPTAGVDPQSRMNLLDMVRLQAKSGVCVLYTTHYMEEAETLCDRLAIVDHGRIIAEGTVEELRAKTGQRDLVRFTGRFDPERDTQALRVIEGLEIVGVDAELLTLAVPEASRKLPAVLTALQNAGAEIRETTLTQPNLESLFIKLTGKELRE